MMAAAQPFPSGAISKTVNMPRETTLADVADAYLEGWQMGLKAWPSIATVRKRASRSPLRTETDKATAKHRFCSAASGCPTRGNRSRTSLGIAGHEGYITVGLGTKMAGRANCSSPWAKEGKGTDRRPDGLLGTAVSMSW